MSDAEVRHAARALAAEETWINRIAFWLAKARAGQTVEEDAEKPCPVCKGTKRRTLYRREHDCWECAETGTALRPPTVLIRPEGEMPEGENPTAATYRVVVGSKATNNPFEVARVFWRFHRFESYECDDKLFLLETTDGRYAFVSDLSSGTCSGCGSCSWDVIFGTDLYEVVRYGMDEESRRLAGLVLPEDGREL